MAFLMLFITFMEIPGVLVRPPAVMILREEVADAWHWSHTCLRVSPIEGVVVEGDQNNQHISKMIKG